MASSKFICRWMTHPNSVRRTIRAKVADRILEIAHQLVKMRMGVSDGFQFGHHAGEYTRQRWI